MEGIETLAIFEEKVAMTPRNLANQKINITSLLLEKLAEKLEGKCSLHGWVVPGSLRILSRSMGYLEKGRFTGDIVFHIQAQANVLNPPSGSHLSGVVTGNNMMGMYVTYKVSKKEEDRKTKETVETEVDAIKMILPRDLHIGDEAFSKVEIGDRVNVEIKKSRFQVNDKFILSVGIFEGKVDSDYVVPQIREEEEEVITEKGPSGEAQRRVQAYEEEAKQKEEEAKATGTYFENNIPPLEVATSATSATLPVQELKYLNTSGLELFASGEPILFNAAKIEANKYLDSRYPAKFTIDGKEWSTVEHYYQAMKFPSFPEYQEQIRAASTAVQAQKLGKAKDPNRPIRADWKEERVRIMRIATFNKFNQNPSLKQLIIDTYPRPLIFADPNDGFWGYGKTQQGQNMLGRTLMEYRSTVTGMTALNG